MKPIVKFLLISILGWASLSKGRAAQNFDLEQMDFYLHTVEVGDLVFNNFGHTALRVHDRLNQRNFILNWGIFDFGEPLDFSLRFYSGDLGYRLGVARLSTTLKRYQLEQRTVWEDKFNLNPIQKKILWDRIVWNLKPENRGYQYQYFFDNCSTRIRDYIDEALGGELKTLTKTRPTNETFRDMVRSHYATNPEISFFLELIMNGRLEGQMSVWQKMFLPISLRHYLLEYVNADGQPILIPGKVLYEFPKPKPYALTGFQLYALLLSIVLALALGLGLLKGSASSRPAYKLWGTFVVFHGFWMGLLGVVLPLNWVFSGHLDLAHNANIAFFWPLDFLFVVLGVKWIMKGGPLLLPTRAFRVLKGYLLTHLIGLPLFSICYALGIIHQDVSLILTYMMPFSLILFLGALGFGVKEKSGARP